MKKLRVNKGNIAIINKKGDFKKMIGAGNHWLGFAEKHQLLNYNVVYKFDPAWECQIPEKVLNHYLKIITIKDHEIGICYDQENFKDVITPGKYAIVKAIGAPKVIVMDTTDPLVGTQLPRRICQYGLLQDYIKKHTVLTHEEALLFVDGNYRQQLKKGDHYFWKNSLSVELMKCDMRQQNIDIAGQEILTKDKASLRINLVIQYQITDIEKALLHNKDVVKQLYITAQLSLREFIGMKSLDDLLENKESISEFIREQIASKTAIYGLSITDCGIKDIILPGDMREIMNQVLIAQKRAQANVISRREETAATRSLLNTAKLMEDNDMLFRLKEMDYVEKIAAKIGEIHVAGNGQLVEQLHGIFSSKITQNKTKA